MPTEQFTAMGAKYGVSLEVCGRYQVGTQRLIPRILQLVEVDAVCQVACSDILANLSCGRDCEFWVNTMVSSDIINIFTRILVNPAGGIANTTVFEALCSCIGNICIQDGNYRDAILAPLTEPLLKIAAVSRVAQKEVCFVAHAASKRLPTIAHTIVQQWLPFCLAIISDRQPLADDTEASWCVRACLLFFLNLAQQESVYRHLIINTTGLLKRCVEFTVSQSIYTLVRIVSCQLLQTLSMEREKQMYLADFMVPSAFFTTLNGTPSAQLRAAAATGLLNFSENPGMVPHFAKERTTLLYHIANSDADTSERLILTLCLLLTQVQDEDLLAQWIQSGALAGVAAALQKTTIQEHTLQKALAALRHLFRCSSGATAVAKFEELGGDELLHNIFMHKDNALASVAERLIDDFFGATAPLGAMDTLE